MFKWRRLNVRFCPPLQGWHCSLSNQMKRAFYFVYVPLFKGFHGLRTLFVEKHCFLLNYEKNVHTLPLNMNTLNLLQRKQWYALRAHISVAAVVCLLTIMTGVCSAQNRTIDSLDNTPAALSAFRKAFQHSPCRFILSAYPLWLPTNTKPECRKSTLEHPRWLNLNAAWAQVRQYRQFEWR